MKTAWLYSSTRGGHVKFAGSKMCSTESEDLNTFVASFMDKYTKTNNNNKVKAKNDSNLEIESDNLNIEKLNIRSYSDLERE